MEVFSILHFFSEKPHVLNINRVYFDISGFGHDLAFKLETLGCTVFAGCLHPNGDGAKKLSAKNSDRMHVLQLDVTNDSHISDAVQYVRKYSRNEGTLYFH